MHHRTDQPFDVDSRDDQPQFSRKELLLAVRHARAEAIRANQAKNDFLAAMSHELRTPLNAIGGYCQLLLMGLRGSLTREQHDDLERIEQNQRHLLGLINSVLNFTKLDAGTVRYRMEPVPVAALLRELKEMLAPHIHAKALRCRLLLCQDHVMIEADADKVRQIIFNLVSNAVKFTPADGMITMGCRLRGRHVYLYVTDTGVGIPREKLAHVFDPFVQVGRTFSTSSEGLGLGLAISRDLARGMGGDMSVRSEVGQGSTFTLTLQRV